MRDRTYFAYIMAGDSGAIYTGVTSNLPVRIGQHKQKLVPGFTQKHNKTALVRAAFEHSCGYFPRKRD